LYDFLLRRKSEVEIQRAANTPDHEIVDYAGDTGISNIAPKPKSAYMNAIIWAILLPAVFLFLIVFLNNRVMALEDIVANTDVPIAGTLAHINEQRLDGVLRSPSSYFTELLRIIRIKLGLDPEKGEQVVLVTSSVPEEGKTFFAINFASVYALTGKRTIFLGFDFRNQTALAEFHLDNSIGITSHLVNNFTLDQVIQKTFTKNLDILLSGPVPPNPDELIESVKTRNMFAELRKRYDYMVVDTPPIGLFGDAFLLNKFVDVSIFMVRHNFTRKREMVHAINDALHNKLTRLSIVYNDANLKVKARDIVVYGEEAPRQFFAIRWAIKARRIIIDLLRKI
jgi:capsular exopolysaccharide synthesis family protein